MREFGLVSGTALVSDPCYEADGRCNLILKGVKKGRWFADSHCGNEGSWGERNRNIVCAHEEYKHFLRSEKPYGWEFASDDIGVDSGQAGVFDIQFFKKDESIAGLAREAKETICEDEPWYSMVCDRTLNDDGFGTIPYGAVSSSGFGDGCYECHVKKDKGEIVAIRIDFIVDEDEEHTCTRCGREIDKGEDLCDDCYAEENEEPRVCEKCSSYLGDDEDGPLCDECQEKKEDEEAEEERRDEKRGLYGDREDPAN